MTGKAKELTRSVWRQCGLTLCLICICFQAVTADQDQVQKLQRVIDSQQKQLDVQQGELKAQRERLDLQSDLLEQMQKQLQVLAGKPKVEAADLSIVQTSPTPAENKGIFIVSDDGKKVFRLYGSVRARATWEDRDNVEPWNLDMATVFTGEDDVRAPKVIFSSNESRIGLDYSIRNLLSMRGEFRLAGLVAPNRVQYSGGTQTLVGWVF